MRGLKIVLMAALAGAGAVAPGAGAADPAQECLAASGTPDAGAPASAPAAKALRAAIEAGAAACARAAEAPDAPPDVLFQAAQAAQLAGDRARAFALYTRAAEADFGPAETRLGDFNTFGLAPGGEDLSAAVTHYQRAAALGDAPGKTTLALLYRLGRGVPRDPARMVALLTEAADAGYHFAALRLAQTYLTGDGVPGGSAPSLGIPDLAKAVHYYTIAAEAGNVGAALELAGLYGTPNGPADDLAAVRRLTSIAARSGDPGAIAAMGLLYEQGRGVGRDPEVAAGLYVKALESGKLAFADLRPDAGGWDRDTAKAFQRQLKARGLYRGAIDGVVGPGTAAAARALKP